jgi:hypothetical protein
MRLRLASLVLLSAWLGAALLTAAVVAPAAFAVLPSRSLAGALVGRVLPVLFLSGAAIGVFEIWRVRLVESRRGVGFIAATLLVASTLVAQFGVSPRIEEIRAGAGQAIDGLAPSDPRRVAFGRLHGISVALLGLGMVAAGISLLMQARAPRPQDPRAG